jgi:S-adenosylmethionine hydrolase
VAAPLITLLTDFGLRDGFVASMKGVILTLAPDARLIDVSHEIEPQDVAGGAFVLETSFRYFPAGTVHLAVVDPGVGSARRGIIVEAAGHRFVGPDNGLLTPALRADPAAAVFGIDARRRRPAPGRTFDGRDLFAPVAAELARGVAAAALGAPVNDSVRLAEIAPTTSGGGLEGRIIWIDRFGNLISNIRAAMLPPRRPVRIAVGDSVIPFAEAYAAVAPGELGALINSDGLLEIFASGASAAVRLGARRGDPVRLSLSD